MQQKEFKKTLPQQTQFSTHRNAISAVNTNWPNLCKKHIFSQQKLQRELKILSQNLSKKFSLAKFTIANLTQALWHLHYNTSLGNDIFDLTDNLFFFQVCISSNGDMRMEEM